MEEVTAMPKTLLKDQNIVEFISQANKFGLGDEAAFIVAMASKGTHLMKSLKKTKVYKASKDDLEFACKIYKVYHDCQKDQPNDAKLKLDVPKVLRMLGVISVNSAILQQFNGVITLANKLVNAKHRETFYRIGHNYVYPDLMYIKTHVLCIKHDLPINVEMTNKPLVFQVSALSHAFCSVFGLKNTIVCAGTERKYYSLFKREQIEISKHSATLHGLFVQEPFSQAVAFSILPRKKKEIRTAQFLCEIPLTLKRSSQHEQIVEYTFSVGSAIREQFVRRIREYFTQSEQFGIVFSHDDGDGKSKFQSKLIVLYLKKTHAVLKDFLHQIICEMAEKEIIWNVLCGQTDAENKSLLTFGPGFQVRHIDNDMTKPTSCILKLTANTMPNANEDRTMLTSTHSNIKDFIKDFCFMNEFIETCTFVHNDQFYITFNEESIANKFIDVLMESQIKHFEFKYVKESLFEFLLSRENQQESDNLMPDDLCVICLSQPTDSNWIRLSFCGHFYCDHCIIGLITTTEQYPIKCPECDEIMSIQDFKAIMGRTFCELDAIREFLLPVLRKSLNQFLRDCLDYIKCLHCKRLVSATGMSENAILCSECSVDHCDRCGENLHEGKTCREKQNEKSDLFDWLNQNPDHRRTCPNPKCKMPIERAEGCNHLECSQCKIHFCWICTEFTAINSGEIYQHMRLRHGGIGLEMNEMALAEIQPFFEPFLNLDDELEPPFDPNVLIHYDRPESRSDPEMERYGDDQALAACRENAERYRGFQF